MKGKQRLVIIGGGFAGLNIAKKIDYSIYDVTVVDAHNYNSFPPLFYQVASSGLEPASISFPFRKELSHKALKGCNFHWGRVSSVDVAKKLVHTQYESIPYDVLIIAAGTTNNFFNMPELKNYVFTLKSNSEAIRCRNEIIERLERAAVCEDPEQRRKLLTFTVIGGGPAGVEIAGALGEVKRWVIKREYPTINPDEVKVILVEGSGKLLGSMSEKSSADALRDLGQLLVDVRLNTIMKSYDGEVATFGDGSTIETEMLIWTAGVVGVPFKLDGTDISAGRGGRFEVDEYNAVKGIDGVYAVGDIAMMPTEDYPHGHPQVAQVAIQQGRRLAKNLNRPDKRRPFAYKDKGSMATIGRNRAVVDMGKMHLGGRIAWLAWMFIHLISLLGMRNRLVVLINWTVSYFTYSSGLRLMLSSSRYPLKNTM